MNRIEQNLSGIGMRVGVVQSRFNEPVCEGLQAACLGELAKLGVAENAITLVTVPGALEIPVMLLKMAQSGRFDALIALGAVIRGDTYHFEVVCNESARGIGEVQLRTGVAVANAVLTTNTDEQAEVRMSVKGAEAAQVAIEMAHLLKDIR